MNVSDMSRKQWEKWLHGSEKDKFDKKVRELYQNCSSTEGKAMISFMNGMFNELLEKLEKERKENEIASI
jgi:hypothetical protein